MTDTNIVPHKQEHPLIVLRSRLEARSSEIKAAWPGVAPERIIRAIITSAQINPDLLATSFQSLFLACMRACRDGLIPDGVEGSIVAFKDRATWIPGYRGLLKKFQLSGQFRHVVSNCVYEGDEFSHYIDEHGEHLRHVPSDTFEDAKIVRVYAMATTKDSGVFITVMPRKEIDKIRKISRSTREDSPWLAHFSEMAKKTALRRLSKLLPSAPLFEDDEEEPLQPQPTPQLAIFNERSPGAAASLEQFAGGLTSPASDGESDGGSVAPAADPTNHLSIAYERGRIAKESGASRRAVPGEYREEANKAELEAWLAGYDGRELGNAEGGA